MSHLSFEVLCVTMGQKNFDKIKQMNIDSNVVFANQSDNNSFQKQSLSNNKNAIMVTTNTIGVGKNRNIALTYSSADICIFADDDICYFEGYENIILNEFQKNKDADLIIFAYTTNDLNRKPPIIKKNKRIRVFSKLPYGGCNIAFRRSSLLESGITFNTLFGGGCKYPSGEDSIFLTQCRNYGLKIYTSVHKIGEISFETSTWFNGYDEKYFFGKGAFYQKCRKRTKYLWYFYFAFKTRSFKEIPFWMKIKTMKNGSKCYKKLICYESFKNECK